MVCGLPPKGVPVAKHPRRGLVGGTGESRLDGIGLSVVYLHFSGANPTTAAPAYVAGVRAAPLSRSTPGAERKGRPAQRGRSCTSRSTPEGGCVRRHVAR